LLRLRQASFLQFMLPGCPSVYYGDEAGMEGCKDPFNRAFYPWEDENKELRAHFAALGTLRKASPTLRRGAMRVLEANNGRLVLAREYGDDSIYVYVNLSNEPMAAAHGEVLFSASTEDGAVLPGGFAAVRGE